MISCHRYDYIEIACTYQYLVKLTLKTGLVLTCKALGTALNEDRAECIKVEIDGKRDLIILDDIVLLEACMPNPHFTFVTFSE